MDLSQLLWTSPRRITARYGPGTSSYRRNG